MALKLGSLKAGGRDGSLLVVSEDLTRAIEVGDIAPTLQYALENWDTALPELRSVYRLLNAGDADGAVDFGAALEQGDVASPLPRAFQWADGSAYVNHVALVRQARGAEIPESFWSDPLMYQGGSDMFVGPRDPIEAVDEAHGIDFEAEVAVITDDVPMGTPPQEAAQHIKLVMLVNDVSLRGLIPGELAKGFGFFHGKPASAFSPAAVAPDTLGTAWRDAKLHLPLHSSINDAPFGKPQAGIDMTFDFAQLIAHAAKTRHLGAGTIVGSGTVSNRDAGGGPGRPIGQGGLGYSCLAEVRMVETIQDGKPRTPFLRFGDTVHIEMRDETGKSIFGAIDQTVEPYRYER